MKSSVAKCFFKEMCWKKVYQEHNRESEKGNHKCLEDIMRSWGNAFLTKEVSLRRVNLQECA